MKMLAFDLGASSGKIFLGKYDGDSLVLGQVSRFNNQPITIRNEIFWNVLDIFHNLQSSISSVLRSGEIIDSVGLDSFSNDFGILDRDGHFVTQVHCYRDGRTKRNEEKIYSLVSKQKLHALCGNQNALFGTLMQLASMKLENQSHLLDGAGSLLFIPDLLAYFLTGEIHSEYTISSVSQMMDLSTGTWSSEILDVFGIPRRIFPEIVQPGTQVGKITGVPDLSPGKKVDVISVCEHDTASAFLAAPYGKDSIIISSGTWSLVGIETSSPIINELTFQNNFANEGGYPGHHRLLKNVMGQWLLQECQRAYFEEGHSYSIIEMMELARLSNPFEFMIDPDDERFFSPGHMIEKISAFCRERAQGSPAFPGQVFRCILESLALKYRLVIEKLEAIMGRHYDTINIIGGGGNNNFLNQCVANVSGKRVLSGPEEATSLGNLLVQLIAAGEIASVGQARELIAASFPVRTFDPMNQSEWESRYQQFVSMIYIEEQNKCRIEK